MPTSGAERLAWPCSLQQFYFYIVTFEKPVSLGDLMLTHLSPIPGAHWVSMVLISWNSIRVQLLEARAVTDSDAEQWRHTSWKLNPFPTITCPHLREEMAEEGNQENRALCVSSKRWTLSAYWESCNLRLSDNLTLLWNRVLLCVWATVTDWVPFPHSYAEAQYFKM